MNSTLMVLEERRPGAISYSTTLPISWSEVDKDSSGCDSNNFFAKSGTREYISYLRKGGNTCLSTMCERV